eukprot:Filipodium_phascolosomae@DN1609_c0_g1_i1.p1
MGNKESTSMEDVIFNLKLKSKQMARESVKCEKQEAEEKLKVKRAIEKGNKEGARIFAQNAIRKKHESFNYLRLSSKMDAIASRLDAAHKTQTMTKELSKAVPSLQKVMESISIEEIGQSMDQFETLFQDLDVRADYVTTAIDSTTATSTPVDQVDGLIQQVAEEHAIDVSEMMTEAPIGTHAPKIGAPEARTEATANLESRLDNLRST